MALPTELVDSLNQTYFLHLLVNDKEKVVPPGKSVFSMLMHSNFRLPQLEPDGHSDLIERVKEAAHKVFWREVSCGCIFFICFIETMYLGYRSAFVSNAVCTAAEAERTVSGSSRSA